MQVALTGCGDCRAWLLLIGITVARGVTTAMLLSFRCCMMSFQDQNVYDGPLPIFFRPKKLPVAHRVASRLLLTLPLSASVPKRSGCVVVLRITLHVPLESQVFAVFSTNGVEFFDFVGRNIMSPPHLTRSLYFRFTHFPKLTWFVLSTLGHGRPHFALDATCVCVNGPSTHE